MPGSTGGGWKRSDLATVTGVAQPTGKPAEDRPQALPSGTATAPALDPTILPRSPISRSEPDGNEPGWGQELPLRLGAGLWLGIADRPLPSLVWGDGDRVAEGWAVGVP